jgi:hypothetical protein
VIVQLDTGTVSIDEPDDCRRLHVATAPPPSDIDEVLRASGMGKLSETGEALLDETELRWRARAAATDWDDNWAAMIDYTTAK